MKQLFFCIVFIFPFIFPFSTGAFIYINEIMPNPSSGEEWVEIYNSLDTPISLNGWRLVEGGGKVFPLSGSLSKNAYAVFDVKALNNTGDDVYLYDSCGTKIDHVRYGKGEFDAAIPAKGLVLSRIAYTGVNALDFIVTDNISKGKENPKIISTKEMLLDDSSLNVHENIDSFDIDQDEDTDVRVTHIDEKDKNNNKEVYIDTQIMHLRISSLYPYPLDGEEEYIEIFNPTSYTISLNGIFLDDMEGGSKPYQIKQDSIKANEKKRFYQSQTKIILNNENDQGRILSPDLEVIHAISYGKVKKGEMIFVSDINEKNTSNTDSKTSAQVQIATTQDMRKNASVIDAYTLYSLADAKQKEKGTQVTVLGIVTSTPHEIIDNAFYVQSDETGMQISFASALKDSIRLQKGDFVQIKGKISSASGEVKVHVSKNDDIYVMGTKDVSTWEKEISHISSQDIGQLIQVFGESKKNKTVFYIQEDEANQLKLSLKKEKNIDMQEKKDVSVIGILRQVNEQYVLFPRDKDDIEYRIQSQHISTLELSTQQITPQKEEISSIVWYASITLFSVLVVLCVLWQKYRPHIKKYIQDYIRKQTSKRISPANVS